MAILVSEIFSTVREVIQDELGVRWDDSELINYLNDAVRTAVLLKPDINPITEEFTCVAGHKQTWASDLATEIVQLLDVTQTTSTGGGTETSVTFIKRNVLDLELPTWRSATPSNTIQHYMYDDKQRDVFYVYPPATAGATIEVVYTGLPVAVIATTDEVPLIDIYAPALTNYVIWRAFTKDSDFAGNLQIAGGYYGAFFQLITGKMMSENVEAPDRKVPPPVVEAVG